MAILLAPPEFRNQGLSDQWSKDLLDRLDLGTIGGGTGSGGGILDMAVVVQELDHQ
jgi:hypothetical protein